jgi:hypothetical protein
MSEGKHEESFASRIYVNDQSIVSNSKSVGLQRRQPCEVASWVPCDRLELGNNPVSNRLIGLVEPIGCKLRELNLERQRLSLGPELPQ